MAKQIIKTDYLDVYRINDGVLLKVYKCKVISHIYCNYNKRQCNKLAENVYEAKVPITLRAFGGENIIPVGAGIVDNSWVEKLNDPSKFRFEIKTTGDSLCGDMELINIRLDSIRSIIDAYLTDLIESR